MVGPDGFYWLKAQMMVVVMVYCNLYQKKIPRQVAKDAC